MLISSRYWSMSRSYMSLFCGILVISGIFLLRDSGLLEITNNAVYKAETKANSTPQGNKTVEAVSVAQQTPQQNKIVNNAPHDNRMPSYAVLIPDDDTLKSMNETQHMALYQRYINTLQVLCKNVIRVGDLKDGGKEICVDDGFQPKAPCLVYSFGINNQFDFDKMVVEFFGCEVHCFDPSMHRRTGRVSDKVWFYDLGLGDQDKANDKRWQIKTLQTIRKELKHQNSTIDILKIDIDGDEWKALPQMVKSGDLNNVKQIALETHFSRRIHHQEKPFWGSVPSDEQLSGLRQLFEAGFRIYMRERNLYPIAKWPGFEHIITNVYEISLLNLRFYRS